MMAAIRFAAPAGIPAGHSIRNGSRASSSSSGASMPSSFFQSTQSIRAASSLYSAANAEPGPHKIRLRKFLLYASAFFRG